MSKVAASKHGGLVLSRIKEQSIVLLDLDHPDRRPVTLTITQVRGNRVQVCISADSGYRIVRGELMAMEAGAS